MARSGGSPPAPAAPSRAPCNSFRLESFIRRLILVSNAPDRPCPRCRRRGRERPRSFPVVIVPTVYSPGASGFQPRTAGAPGTPWELGKKDNYFTELSWQKRIVCVLLVGPCRQQMSRRPMWPGERPGRGRARGIERCRWNQRGWSAYGRADDGLADSSQADSGSAYRAWMQCK